MSDSQSNAALRQLLVSIGRSLLQYTGESWPWTAAGSESSRQTIEQLVARQQMHVARIAGLLSERESFVDFGTYPTDYTDLHYVALGYLLDQLIADEESLISQLTDATTACADDPEALEVVESALSDERDAVAKLGELSESAAAAIRV